MTLPQCTSPPLHASLSPDGQCIGGTVRMREAVLAALSVSGFVGAMFQVRVKDRTRREYEGWCIGPCRQAWCPCLAKAKLSVFSFCFVVFSSREGVFFVCF